MHELTSTDGLVLVRESAWHGLGTIVQEAPTPREALKIAGLDWEVRQEPLYRSSDISQGWHKVKTHVTNVRCDTNTVLGVVGKGWTPFQNTELADFCEQLHESGDVRIETAGSIRGGEKVWFLLQGKQFDVKNKDAIFPYILVSNGFDGGTALRCTPTTVRVVCSNTLHMVIPRFDAADTGRVKSVGNAAFVVRHSGKLKERIEEARKALKMYNVRLEENRKLMEALAEVDVNSAKIKKFFLEMHQRHFGVVEDKPVTSKQIRARQRAMDGIHACIERFEKEKEVAGATAWNMFNAYSGMIQHDYESRRKDPLVRREAKLSSNLFGVNADRTIETLRYALQLAT